MLSERQGGRARRAERFFYEHLARAAGGRLERQKSCDSATGAFAMLAAAE
jgi:hypothetical protein